MDLTPASDLAALQAADRESLALPICSSRSVGKSLTVSHSAKNWLASSDMIDALAVGQIQLGIRSYVVKLCLPSMEDNTRAKCFVKIVIETL